MAVGVEPMSWMALVVQASDNTVGIMARAMRLSQPLLTAGRVSGLPSGIITINITHPQLRT